MARRRQSARSGGIIRLLEIGYEHKDTHMQLIYNPGDVRSVEADLAIIGAFAGEPLPDLATGLVEEGDFKGKFKQTIVLYPRSNSAPLDVSSRTGTQAQSAGL